MADGLSDPIAALIADDPRAEADLQTAIAAELNAATSTPLNPGVTTAPSTPPVTDDRQGPRQEVWNGVESHVTATDPNINKAIQPITTAPVIKDNDLRVRLRAQVQAKAQVYGPPGDTNILNILYETNGMLFPYTPTIQYSQIVDYRAMEMVHTNQDFYAYGRTPSLELTVIGEFTVQNYREGRYALACLHFLRTVSKMYFGEKSAGISGNNPQGGLAGTPPPVLLFSGYGNYMFNDLRVIVKNHSYSLDKAVDYINVLTAGGVARIPSYFTISVQLVVQNTPNRLRTEFDLDDFRQGKLMRDGNTGWI